MFGFVDQLAITVVSRINAAAAINPINLIATALLSTPRQAIEGDLLKRQLNLLHGLLTNIPFSQQMTLPEPDARGWIDYAVQMGKLRLIPQKLGNLYGLDAQNTVLLSYYRNNVQHLFALPSLIAALIVRANGISNEALFEQISMIFPYIRSELFIHLSKEEIQQQASRILAYMEAEQLITVNHNGLIHAPEKTRDQSLQLQYLANIMLPTLERYLITLSVLVRLGSGHCSQTILENQAQQMAQRLALLSGLDAPEFFDKALFKGFIQTLKNKRVLTLTEEGNLAYDDRIQEVIAQASLVIPDDVWYNIYQVTKRSTNTKLLTD
jgi:glycerol-3-phosphate O-acyltransferase